ncbi:XAC0095 family protein [Luteimonas saliphila]|uniref:XAC0095 family protein n=1 Tax=Luteimonas saliphila TaxID=2804919 RepID=UPI00192E2205|nr:hypothetical protein [Luteimonas saliphila]
MSKYELDEMDTTGYFLPEESHFRLKKLHGHMEFLSQLAQPRRHDEEETGFGPEISGDELAVCLELLAEQAERVLDEVTWPAERVVDDEQSQARDEDGASEEMTQANEPLAAGEQDEEAGEALAAGSQDDDVDEAPDTGLQDDEPGEADTVATAKDTKDPLVFGMTLDQLDTLNRLHGRLYAFGDLVFGAERIDLADGTLTALGDVIFEEADAASELMDKVAGQRLPEVARGTRRVREARAGYGARAAPLVSGRVSRPALPGTARLVLTEPSASPGQRLH